MIVKLGDLVQIKLHSQTSKIRNKNEIWLVIGWNGFNDYISVQNVSTGERCQINLSVLKHFKSDKK